MTVSENVITCFSLSGVVVIIAAGIAYCVCKKRRTEQNTSSFTGRQIAQHSLKNGDSMLWDNLPLPLRRQHRGSVTQQVSSQTDCDSGRAPPSREASRIARGSDNIQQLQYAETPTCEMRNKIQLAISDMQSALQDELQEDELKIHGVLGQGAFGTVYHGMCCSMTQFYRARYIMSPIRFFRHFRRPCSAPPRRTIKNAKRKDT